MRTYTTTSGDTWDLIALKELGSEYLFPLLLKENQSYRNQVKFSSGIVLNIPDIPDATIYDGGPDWLSPAEDPTESSEDVTVLHGVDA